MPLVLLEVLPNSRDQNKGSANATERIPQRGMNGLSAKTPTPINAVTSTYNPIGLWPLYIF